MRHEIAWRATALFIGVHGAAVVGVALLGISWSGLGLALALYAVRMFTLTAGVHRYFAHHAFKTSRAFQFVLAMVATSSAQLGVLWWASQHRIHHRHTESDADPHSRAKGFWWAHVGWFLVHTYDETQWDQIRDFAKYRELRWLDRNYFVPVIALVVALFALGGIPAVVWGFCVSTVLVWHAMFSLNSVGHSIGPQRYDTGDESRNNALVALATFGEGWHNNHHFYPGSARNGFYWWEIDVSYYVLRVLEASGLVWDLKIVPEQVRERHADPEALNAAVRRA